MARGRGGGAVFVRSSGFGLLGYPDRFAALRKPNRFGSGLRTLLSLAICGVLAGMALSLWSVERGLAEVAALAPPERVLGKMLCAMSSFKELASKVWRYLHSRY